MLQFSENINVVIAVNKPSVRKKFVDKLSQNPNIIFPNIIHPSCIDYSNTPQSGIGNILFLFVIVSFNVKLGNFNIFNSYTSLGHDVIMDDYNSFNPRVSISGGVTLGSLNEFGLNSSVVQYKKIGSNNMIGAHTLIIKNVKSDCFYFGTPGQKVNL